MRNNDGFTLLESIVAMTIIFSLMLTILPIHSTLQLERALNKEKRDITYHLHDELLYALEATNQLKSNYIIETVFTNLQIEFTETKNTLKACATWIDLKERDQEVCLYGYV